jgi:hypothetical protein
MEHENLNIPQNPPLQQTAVSGCAICLERIEFLKKQRELQPFPQSYFTLQAITILELKVKGIYRCGRGSHCR